MKCLHIIYSVLCIVLLYSCRPGAQMLPFDSFKTLAGKKNILLVSCLRCICTDQELEYIYNKRPSVFNNFDIYMDTTCRIKGFKPVNIVHIPQAKLDTLSADLYNMAIIDVQEKTVRLVTTEEMEQLPNLLRKYL